jgi:hypothetical protein
MMAKSLSQIAQVAYLDLLRLHQDDVAAEMIGSLETRQRGGRAYLYDRFRLGTEMKARYLGEDTPQLRARLAQSETLRANATARAQEMARLARILRAEGLFAADRNTGMLLSAFARAGVFRLGGTLVGTAAFALYQGELGLRMNSDDLAQTGDIDFASFERLSMALGDRVEEQPSDILAALKFDPIPSLDGREVWKWRQSNGIGLVEFLAPAFGEETIKPLTALGVSAQGLNYLNYLIAEPIKAVALYRAGVLVQIPRPERFAIHKLIVADRRQGGPDHAKSRKDRAQAAFLIDALVDDRPSDLKDAYEDALSRGPRWRERIASSLSRMPQTRTQLEGL